MLNLTYLCICQESLILTSRASYERNNLQQAVNLILSGYEVENHSYFAQRKLDIIHIYFFVIFFGFIFMFTYNLHT